MTPDAVKGQAEGCPVTGTTRSRTAADVVGETHRVESWSDVIETLRNSKLVALLHDDSEPFRGGTVRQIDGAPHHRRRKTMGQLLRGEGDDWFREEVLIPTIRRNLDAVLDNPDEDGVSRVDMVALVRRAFYQLAASLIGLRGVEDLEEAETLRRFSEPIGQAMRAYYVEGDQAEILAGGLDAKERFRERYFDPAYRYHEELIESVERGEREGSDLPHDFLTLVCQGVDEELSSDRELVLREALTDFINAGTFSSAYTLLHVLDELFDWFEAHPQDRELSTDPEFLYGAVAEGLRLHPVVPLLWRLAEEDVTLSSGLEIKRGDAVCVDVRPANRDVGVYGVGADTFDPRREPIKGVYQYGLSFGTGRHMCFGLPLILGSTGVNGSHVQLIKAFFEAGIARDPDSPAKLTGDTTDLAMWESYPVVFGAAGD